MAGDGDAAVDEQRGRVARRVAKQVDVERVLSVERVLNVKRVLNAT